MLPRPSALDSFRPPSVLQVLDLPSFTTAQSIDERLSLPSIGHDISRPSSTSTQSSSVHPHSLQRHGSNSSLQLPGLSALASIASSSPAASNSPNNSHHNNTPNSRPLNFNAGMTYATSAPATSGGQGNSPPVCQNCTTSTTPLWRRDESGSVLCNACGLFLKLHGRPRPISLKTDVIKSRNRVKTTGQGPRKKPSSDANGLPAAHPDADATLSALTQHRRTSQKISSGTSDRSNSPISRTGTPGLQHPSNIAPQHMFDGVIDSHTFHSPSLPSFNLRQPSPGSTSSVNGSHLEPPLPYDALLAQNTQLKTRVSELEVINDLFRGRVTELEHSEQNARRASRETEAHLRADLEEVRQREADLKRRLDELEAEGPRHKKMRLSDIVDESQASTPLSSTAEHSG